MSGALIQLVSKGVQDVYLTNTEGGLSLFSIKYSRHNNYSHAPKYIKTLTDKDTSIIIPNLGDLINGLWVEGADIITKFDGATVDLYIGGQKIDSHTNDFTADIWQNYMADTWCRSQQINNKASTTNVNFAPFHFFFCNKNSFLPLVALQYHQVEIKITFKPGVSFADMKLYANYIFLDAPERKRFTSEKHDFIITQVQTLNRPLKIGYNDIDISQFNHPVRSLFFGFSLLTSNPVNDFFSFETCDVQINGTPLIENMTPIYFHSVQNYNHSEFGISNFIEQYKCPFYTRFFAYHFCMNASDYKPSGTCNFSRLDNAKLILRNVVKGSNRTAEDISVYAVNYNVLRIQNGMAGILFGN